MTKIKTAQNSDPIKVPQNLELLANTAQLLDPFNVPNADQEIDHSNSSKTSYQSVGSYLKNAAQRLSSSRLLACCQLRTRVQFWAIISIIGTIPPLVILLHD